MPVFRPARPSDAEAVALLHAQSWRENYRGAFEDSFLDGDLAGERRQVWRERLDGRARNQLVRIAVERDELLGFVCVYGADVPEWGALIDNLHVADAGKRRGIGSALMTQAGAWLAESYADQGVYLWVLERNASARRFYESLGAGNAGVSVMETHGGAVVCSCRYTWSRPALLAGARSR